MRDKRSFFFCWPLRAPVIRRNPARRARGGAAQGPHSAQQRPACALYRTFQPGDEPTGRLPSGRDQRAPPAATPRGGCAGGQEFSQHGNSFGQSAPGHVLAAGAEPFQHRSPLPAPAGRNRTAFLCAAYAACCRRCRLDKPRAPAQPRSSSAAAAISPRPAAGLTAGPPRTGPGAKP